MDDWERVDTGRPEPQRLHAVRDVATRHEPLVETAEFGDRVDPQVVHLYVADGLRGDHGRFDVTWTDRDYYRYHYTEGAAFNCRYDRHPRPAPDVPEKHFHEPPDAAHDAVRSCIEVESVFLVTLAVLHCWRDAVDEGDPGLLQQPEPP